LQEKTLRESRKSPVRAIEDAALAARVTAAHSLTAVTAGSALLRVGNRLLAVHDDAFRLSWISLPDLAISPMVLRGDGAALAKPIKPDFESAVRTPDGLIHLLGSGSTAARCTIVRIDLARSTVALVENPEIYRCIQEALELEERPNIEGAIVDGEGLRVFHRGIGATPSASVDLPLAVLYGKPPRALATQSFELGALDGVRLAFTDVAAIADERTVFAAAAEETADAVLDGPVAGSVIGFIETRRRTSTARWTRLLEADGLPSRHKVEGLVIDEDLRGGWILTDADDPTLPTTLARIELDGFGQGTRSI
jgi:uncharacterized protein DUF6929